MRFTPRLYGEFRKGFWFKNIWKTKSQAKLAALKVPTALQEAGIEPLDIVKEIKEKKKIPVSTVIWSNYHPKFVSKSNPSHHSMNLLSNKHGVVVVCRWTGG